MRLVMLATSASHHPSPRGRWLPLARHLSTYDVQTTFLGLHPTWTATLARADHTTGVCITHVAPMHVDVHGPLHGWRLYAQVLRAVWQLTRHAVAIRPDVICICKAQPANSVAGWLAHRITGARLVLDSDDDETGSHHYETAWHAWVMAWIERTTTTHVTSVSTASSLLMDRAQQWGATCVAHIATGITIPTTELTLTVALPPRYMVYVGNLATQAHGLDILLRALALNTQLPPLVIAGDGHEANRLREMATQLGVTARCLWLGAIPSEHVPMLLRNAVVSIDPVHDHPAAAARFPLKILESLAVGTPVITSPLGDRADMIGDAGMLVPAGDAAALAQACATIMTQTFVRAHVQQRAARYAWAPLAQAWGVFHHLL